MGSSTTETATQLIATIDAWRDRLLALDDAIVLHKPSPDRWAIAEVLGHLVDSACNNHQRFIRAQEGDALTFPKYDQNAWVACGGYRHSDWKSLVLLWYFYNRHLADVIRGIPAAKLNVRCTITPYEPCSLEFLVTDYLTHLQHHLAKLAERIETAVG